MNRENIKKVRDVIAGLPPERFNMDRWGSTIGSIKKAAPARIARDCGTSACIAGWAVSVLKPRTPWNSIEDVARDLLGLPYYDAHDLFYAEDTDLSREEITQAKAVAVLDHLLATGKVDWSVAEQVTA